MKKTTLKVSATAPNQELVTNTISYANPNATDLVLSNFAKACNNLTQNTYVDTERIDSQSLNEATA